jgi:orotidine-5'-phosphate decarboxylase
MSGFRERLAARQTAAKTLVCVGLDPEMDKIPGCIRDRPGPDSDKVRDWMMEIVRATAEYASMFKPQIAHWADIFDGTLALRRLILKIRHEFPEIPIFLDCKRGDIARTQRHYRGEAFVQIGADGMNFSPYMGRDCMAALVDENNPGKALVGLCYTSNPDAREIQDMCILGYQPFNYIWERVAHLTMGWAQELGVLENAGLVMAAAYENPKGSGKVFSEHLTRCRQIVGDKMWFLIPGVGTQLGFVAETVRAAYVGPGSIAINSSSDIIFASSGIDFAEAAAKKALALRDQINAAIQSMGMDSLSIH